MSPRVRRHKSDTKTFEELDFVGQARSINAQISVLGRAIRANLRKAWQDGRDFRHFRKIRASQIERLHKRIAAFNI